jgi:hypothetical protein
VLFRSGTLEQIAAPSGVYLGHRAEIDSRGRVFSASVYEEVLRETGAIVAKHAFDEGFFGPCGIDAFVIDRGSDARAEAGTKGGAPEEILRPLVEFNARFTMGTIAIGIVRRAIDRIREPLALTPGMRCAFYFGLDAPPSGWESIFEAVPGRKWLIPLWHPEDEMKPAILFAESRSALDDVVAAARQPKPNRQGPRKPAA